MRLKLLEIKQDGITTPLAISEDGELWTKVSDQWHPVYDTILIKNEQVNDE